MASRPHTLTISVNPVLVGSALAWAETGRIDIPLMLLSMLGALLLQAGTNLDNDVSDFQRGTDRAGRLGLPRATALGLLTTGQVRTASRACFAVATVIGLILAWRGGWPIFIAGLASAAAAMTYSGGPRPISYTPFGDFVVFVFFGLVAVGGTYFLQTLTLSPAVLVAATMVGLPAAAVLVVNNYRDLDPDRQVGKRTLAVCFGRPFGRWQYAVLMFAPFGLLACLSVLRRAWRPAADSTAVIADGHRPRAAVLARDAGPAFNALLAQTAKFQVIFSLLLSLAIL